MSRRRESGRLKRLRSQRGYKLAAALLSALLLVGGLSVSIEGLYHGSAAVARARHLATASALARGEMERLRAEGVPAVGEHKLAPPGLEALPGGEALAAIERHSAALREVKVTMRWREPFGPARSAELVTLLPAGREGGRP